MNIFVLDENPVKAAQMQCDKHVVKMVLESAQMLSTAHRVLDGKQHKVKSKSGKTMVKSWVLPDERENVLYNAVHVNHPCTIWTCESAANYNWHYTHFKALAEEYEYRYGKQHKSYIKLKDILRPSPNKIDKCVPTRFKLAMGAAPECIDHFDPIGSYRAFYKTKKDRFKMVWTGRPIPEWFNE